MNEQKAREIFAKANFVNDLGIQIEELTHDFCQTTMVISPRHLQQTQVVHAGVLATIADHTAGGAAATGIGDNEYVLSIEFKISLFRPAAGERLRCRSRVLKAGKTLVFSESEVFAVSGEKETLTAKASVTLAVLQVR